jgi:circadian clock protein KaiC
MHIEDAKTGIAGLDEVLAGGLARGQIFLLEGTPGAGKTTLALPFLREGARNGDRGLYITLSETEAELRNSAATHGWDLGPEIVVFELAPPEALLDENQQQSLLYSSDLELGETTQEIAVALDRVKPSLVVLDSLSEIRLLAQSSLRYRRQVLKLKHYLARRGATVLILDDLTANDVDKTVHSVVHGVIRLEELTPSYGAERRRLRISKYRGRRYRGGYHDFIITTGGLQVFPRLVAAEHRRRFERIAQSSGNQEFDLLLGGGVDAGSSALVIGPAGTGKSLIAMSFAAAAVGRGDKAALFIFDEELNLLFDRMRNVGIDIEGMRDRGELYIEQVDAAELSPGEFAHRVRSMVGSLGSKTVIIDSLNGYHAAMPEERELTLHIHELLQYLNRQGATTFMTVAQHGLVGDMQSPFDVTYLADTVILLRYFEAAGEVRRAVSVIKKRAGAHEPTIREFAIGPGGLRLGDPLLQFQGVLRGVPTFVGELPVLRNATT